MISELSIGQGNVNVEGTISDIGEVKSFNRFGKELSVANAMLKDDSGSIKLTLWNEDVTRFKDGDKIKIINGYVNEFQGEKQLTSGKFGSMEKLDGSQETLSETPAEEETPSDDSTEKPSEESTETKTESETPAEETNVESEEPDTESTEKEEPKEEVF